jgi:2-C-methyl-D-erythritol 4-phosphate cytidylyltransferase
VVVAAGSGARFGGRKQFARLAGRPVAAWSLDAARATCDGVVLVVPAAPGAEPLPDLGELGPVDAVVTGGATRSASVRAGLAAVPAAAAVIAVHDAARPLAGPALWRAVLAAVRAGADGAVPVVAVADTIRRVEADGAMHAVDRASLRSVQTPQAFRAAAIRAAHAGGDEATDDATLVEAGGGRVVLVAGHAANAKITGPSDLTVAAALLPEVLRP